MIKERFGKNTLTGPLLKARSAIRRLAEVKNVASAECSITENSNCR